MLCSPPIRFLGSSFLGRIPLSDFDPETIIPLARPGTEKISGFPLAVYFQAIKRVIEKKDFMGLLGALMTRLDREVTLNDIKEILIYSEKHGGDYHPAKIEVLLRDQVVSFALNVALTDRGRTVLAREFEVLGELSRKYGQPFHPRVYFLDETEAVSVPGGENLLLMYLADWLEGFFEFHLSRDPSDGQQKLVLWDSAAHDHILSAEAAQAVYRGIAGILTTYYDWGTFAQIYPWHLAAGDFIARVDQDRVDVRLVAARQYGPLIGPEDLPRERALLFFLLNLTLRIRLDRLDGVGEIVWAGDGCLRPAREGFFLALGEKIKRGEIVEEFFKDFRNFLKAVNLEDLEEFFSALAAAGDPLAPEVPVIIKYLDEHLRIVFNLFSI